MQVQAVYVSLRVKYIASFVLATFLHLLAIRDGEAQEAIKIAISLQWNVLLLKSLWFRPFTSCSIHWKLFLIVKSCSLQDQVVTRTHTCIHTHMMITTTLHLRTWVNQIQTHLWIPLLGLIRYKHMCDYCGLWIIRYRHICTCTWCSALLSLWSHVYLQHICSWMQKS